MRNFLIAIVIVFGLAMPSMANHIKSGEGSFTFDDWEGPQIKVYYVAPEKLTPNTPVLFVMHGARRDADRYQREWRDLARELGVIALFPHFSRKGFPRRSYIFGNMFDGNGTAVQPDLWAFTAIEKIFDGVRENAELKAQTYWLYGHSGGAQFAHRFLLFAPDSRASLVIAANAGWYTVLDGEAEFPYGVKHTGATADSLTNALERRVIILLGNRDTDPGHPSLNRTDGADKQGPHRFARGHNFYWSAVQSAKILGADLNWSLSIVPGAGHDNAVMAKAALDLFQTSRSNIRTATK